MSVKRTVVAAKRIRNFAACIILVASILYVGAILDEMDIEWQAYQSPEVTAPTPSEVQQGMIGATASHEKRLSDILEYDPFSTGPRDLFLDASVKRALSAVDEATMRGLSQAEKNAAAHSYHKSRPPTPETVKASMLRLRELEAKKYNLEYGLYWPSALLTIAAVVLGPVFAFLACIWLLTGPMWRLIKWLSASDIS